jgi:predicted Zn-dependent protease
MLREGINIRLLIMLGIMGFSVVKYFATTSTNPVTGEKQHVSLTPQQEVAMGLQSAPQMAQQFGGEFADQKVQSAIKTIGAKLVQNTQAAQSPYTFQFHVLADPETINAFALPGGQIFITVGLLKHLENEDQIAGVLGHEMGHVINRHSAQQMSKQGLLQGIVQGVNVANMVNLKYGRNDELEADKFGLHYMVENGYRPSQMVRVMEILQQTMGNNRQSEFSSSHPSPENRIIKLKEEMTKMGVAVDK